MIDISRVLKYLLKGDENPYKELISNSDDPLLVYIRSLFEEEEVIGIPILEEEVMEEIRLELTKLWSSNHNEVLKQAIYRCFNLNSPFKEDWAWEEVTIEVWLLYQENILKCLKEKYFFSTDIAKALDSLRHKGLLTSQILYGEKEVEPYVSVEDILGIARVNPECIDHLISLTKYGFDSFTLQELQELCCLGVESCSMYLGSKLIPLDPYSRNSMSEGFWVLGVAKRIAPISLYKLNEEVYSNSTSIERYSWYDYYSSSTSYIHPNKRQDLGFKHAQIEVIDPENPLGPFITLFNFLSGVRGYMKRPTYQEVLRDVKKLEEKYPYEPVEDIELEEF